MSQFNWCVSKCEEQFSITNPSLCLSEYSGSHLSDNDRVRLNLFHINCNKTTDSHPVFAVPGINYIDCALYTLVENKPGPPSIEDQAKAVSKYHCCERLFKHGNTAKPSLLGFLVPVRDGRVKFISSKLQIFQSLSTR